MNGAEVLDVGRDAIWLTIQLCLPVLLVGLVVGGSIFETLRLRAGGDEVAQMVGARLLARDAALLASEAKVAHLSAELSTRTAEIEHLKLVLTKLKRMQFGRRSEKLDQQIEQLELQLARVLKQWSDWVLVQRLQNITRLSKKAVMRRKLPRNYNKNTIKHKTKQLTRWEALHH